MLYFWLNRILPWRDQRDQPDNSATRLDVAPGRVVALPTGKTLRIRVISGTAYITYTGRDLLLWRGDSERLNAMPRRIWGAPLLSALGTEPVTVTFSNAEER